MKNDRKVRETLAKIGTLAGVGEDWYEIGEAEYDDVADDNVRYGVYAKSDEIADKVGKVLDKLMADRKTENSSEIPNNCEVKNYCDDCLYNDTCDSKEFFYACTSKATISKMEQVEDEPQTESTGSPIGDYRDGVGAWQTDCPWK